MTNIILSIAGLLSAIVLQSVLSKSVKFRMLAVIGSTFLFFTFTAHSFTFLPVFGICIYWGLIFWNGKWNSFIEGFGACLWILWIFQLGEFIFPFPIAMVVAAVISWMVVHNRILVNYYKRSPILFLILGIIVWESSRIYVTNNYGLILLLIIPMIWYIYRKFEAVYITKNFKEWKMQLMNQEHIYKDKDWHELVHLQGKLQYYQDINASQQAEAVRKKIDSLLAHQRIQWQQAPILYQYSKRYPMEVEYLDWDEEDLPSLYDWDRYLDRLFCRLPDNPFHLDLKWINNQRAMIIRFSGSKPLRIPSSPHILSTQFEDGDEIILTALISTDKSPE